MTKNKDSVWDASIKSLSFRCGVEWRQSVDALARLQDRESQYYKDIARYSALLYEINELVDAEYERDAP